MALNWTPSRENIRQQIQQINFILANPLHPVCKLFLSYWSREELEERREKLVTMYRQRYQDRQPLQLQPVTA